jgi:hypothetical protein
MKHLFPLLALLSTSAMAVPLRLSCTGQLESTWVGFEYEETIRCWRCTDPEIYVTAKIILPIGPRGSSVTQLYKRKEQLLVKFGEPHGAGFPEQWERSFPEEIGFAWHAGNTYSLTFEDQKTPLRCD